MTVKEEDLREEYRRQSEEFQDAVDFGTFVEMCLEVNPDLSVLYEEK